MFKNFFRPSEAVSGYSLEAKAHRLELDSEFAAPEWMGISLRR